jgi:ubiquinone/menaquinone biosynthesis C-methylase UbiE
MSPTVPDRPDYLARAEPALDDATASALDELPLWSSRFGALLLDHLPLDASARVLDVACGTGFPALEIAARLGPRARVVGIDPWRGALRRGESKRRFHDLEQARFVAGDAARLPFRDRAFTLVTCNLGLNNFAEPAAALAECARVLDPPGTLLATTNPIGHMAELYAEYRTVLEGLRERDALERLRANEAHRGSVDSLRELLADAGLEVHRVVEDRFAFRFADGGALLRHPLVRIGFLGGWREAAGPGREAAIFTALEERLDRRAAREGGLVVHVPMLLILARVAPPRPLA